MMIIIILKICYYNINNTNITVKSKVYIIKLLKDKGDIIMRRKISKIIFPLAIGCLLLTGCDSNIEIVMEKEFEDKAIVKDVNYIPRKTIIDYVGRTAMERDIPAKYYVALDYNKVIIEKDDEIIYNICKDKLYKEINCKFIMTEYSNGSSKIELIEVRDK